MAVYAVYAISSLDTGSPLRHRTPCYAVGTHQRVWGLTTTYIHIQVSPYFDPTYTRTGWIGQPPVLDRHEVVTIDGDVVTLRQATP